MTTARLNILHVGKFYRPHRGGIESHLEVLCSALRHRVDLEVVVANDGRGTVREIVDGVSVTRLGSILSFGSTSICPRLPTLLRDSRADIIHIHVPHPVAIAAYLMSSNSCRLVVTYHSDIVRQRLIGAALEPLLHRALARSSAVIATSQRYLDSSPVLGLYRDRCHVVPNAVQIERFDAPLANEVSGIKQRFGSRIVLTVGRLVYYKGLEYLIDAMVGIDAKLLIIGDGPFRTKLQRQIARLGLQERVIMMGEVDDVVPYYQAADVLALPSIARSEAFGIVQVEAMACGKPVVNTHLDSGVPFVSVHGSTGITVESRNSEALGNAIVRLLKDADLRAKYGRAAQRRVRDHFTAEGAARQHLDIYQRVMGRAHPGRVWSRDSQESAATNIAR